MSPTDGILIVDVYIHAKRQAEIQQNGRFVMLERLIARIRSDSLVTLGRGNIDTMDEIKALGDTAAHDRTYITEALDLGDDLKTRYRKMIKEVIHLAGISPKP